MIQIPVILLTLGFAAAIVNPEASLHPQPAAEQPEKPEVAVNALAAPARITATLPENILDAKQAATIALDYTPGDGDGGQGVEGKGEGKEQFFYGVLRRGMYGRFMLSASPPAAP